MTITDIQARVMHQIGGDESDLSEYIPFLWEYIFEGYDRLVYAWTQVHPEELPPDDDELDALPRWAHGAIADYATWMLYRNGNGTRQQRGQAFLSEFYRVESRLINERSGDHRKYFINIPL